MKRIAGSILVVLFVATGASAQFTRIGASDFAKDPAKVAALKRAVTRMKERNSRSRTTADFRQSWVYWANTHGYFGTGPRASGSAAAFKASARQRCAGFTGQMFTTCVGYYAHVQDYALPNDRITVNVWGTCQHGNLQFLPWHRIYLKYFERTLRKFSGDPNFALPYWDYPNTTGPDGGVALPVMMRGTASSNSLVDTFRTPGLNNNTSDIDPLDASAVQAFDFTVFTPFSQTLEGQPHGTMHCGTGTNCQAPDIGIVPVAGLDPVFYMHHANIDRLWQCWMVRKANGAKIDLAWAKANLGMPQSWFDQSWSFVNENGQAVSMKVSQLFEPGGIDYVYDKVTDCVPAVPPQPESPAGADELGTVTNVAPVELRGRTLAVPLAPSTQEGPERRLPEQIQVEPGRTVLILEDVRVQGGNPGVTYRIVLHRRGDPTRRAYVATINWFGILHSEHGGHEGAEGAPGHRILFYDVTDELGQIGNPGEADISVSFEPTRGGAGRESPQPSASAGTVTVRSIRLQTAR